MNRALIITVAGESKRFRETLGAEVLKCIYSDSNFVKTILNYQLSLAKDFENIVIIGGYKFDELSVFVKSNYPDNRIKLLFNDKFDIYGSGYSLYLGIDYLKNMNCDEIVFCEGDLYFDKESFYSIILEEKDVISSNCEPIDARKSVAFYSTICDKIRYIYDVEHSKFKINEPFVGIYNSGQVWKFTNQDKLNLVINQLTKVQIKGTNLEIIESYFSGESKYTVIQFVEWINCNTVEEYKVIEKKL